MKTSKTAIALGLALLLSVSFLSGCNSGVQPKSSQSPQQTSNAATDAKTNTAAPSTNPSTSSIVIPEPDGWTKVNGSGVEVQYLKGTASFIVKTEVFESTALDDIAKEDADYLAKAFDNAKFVEPTKTTIGGKDAIKITFTYGEDAFSMKFDTFLIMSGVSTYTITCADLESSFDAAGFDKILSSIEFK